MAEALRRVGPVALVLLWMLAVQGVQAGDARSYVVEGSRAAGLGECVKPAAQMRRQHMEFIKHQRIATVHEGVRDTRYSLAGCVACHVRYDEQRIPTPINHPDQFCGACHAFAAVDLNCFDCHAAVPNDGQESVSLSRRKGEAHP